MASVDSYHSNCLWHLQLDSHLIAVFSRRLCFCGLQKHGCHPNAPKYARCQRKWHFTTYTSKTRWEKQLQAREVWASTDSPYQGGIRLFLFSKQFGRLRIIKKQASWIAVWSMRLLGLEVFGTACIISWFMSFKLCYSVVHSTYYIQNVVSQCVTALVHMHTAPVSHVLCPCICVQLYYSSDSWSTMTLIHVQLCMRTLYMCTQIDCQQ